MNKHFEPSFEWEVETAPLMYQDVSGITRVDNNFQVISRNDNHNVLSVMSKGYNPMNNANFQESVNRLSDICEFPIIGYQEFQGGGVTLAILKNDREDMKVGDYPIDDYLIVGSSFNGDKPFFVGTSTILIRCQNAFSRINQIDKVRHTKNAPIRREELFSYFKNYTQGRQALYSNFEAMMKINVDQNMINKYISQVLAVPDLNSGVELHTRTLNRVDELRENIMGEISDVGMNVFGLFQGVTKYTTHTLKPRIDGTFGNILGVADTYNQKGYKTAMSLLAA